MLDEYPRIQALVAQDFDKVEVARRGACGLSIESIFRYTVLKQITGLSYQKLAFHLSDSPTYRIRGSGEELPSVILRTRPF